MTSASTKVGEIFSAAGAAFTKLGELTMQLHPAVDPSLAGSPPCSGQTKNTVKRKLYEEGALPASDGPKKVSKKSAAAAARTAPSTAAALPLSAAQFVGASAPLTATSSQAPLRKPKTADVTLSALNDSDVNSDLVDIEGLTERSTTKKLNNFDQDNLSLDSSLIMTPGDLPLLSR
ncbi:chromatin complexes subunit BAP18 isoform X1 [Gouania willdenowi]|uniref:Chromatin complexes subunit BAP18-like n=1 Tax=Gouania willdenowi TaxID=441366 RepID=A0A8C5E7W9_GOUWI|nr:chromatin complexes subunit BAP18-like isoform X1 [Gouania willdenowi]